MSILRYRVGEDISRYIIELANIAWINDKVKSSLKSLKDELISAEMTLRDNKVYMFNNIICNDMLDSTIYNLSILKQFNRIDFETKFILINWINSVYFSLTPDLYKYGPKLSVVEDMIGVGTAPNLKINEDYVI